MRRAASDSPLSPPAGAPNDAPAYRSTALRHPDSSTVVPVTVPVDDAADVWTDEDFRLVEPLSTASRAGRDRTSSRPCCAARDDGRRLLPNAASDAAPSGADGSAAGRGVVS